MADERAIAAAVERLTEAVGRLDPHPSDAAATLVNVGDLRVVLRILAARASADGERAAVERLCDLTRRLGFGDNITEPQADNDTIVAWFEEQGRDASEWREHELWRGDCYVAGHPEDEDCAEHGPTCCLRSHAIAAIPGDDAARALAERIAERFTSCWCNPEPRPRREDCPQHGSDLAKRMAHAALDFAEVRAAHAADGAEAGR